MSKALWDTPRAWKALYKNGLLLLLLLLSSSSFSLSIERCSSQLFLASSTPLCDIAYPAHDARVSKNTWGSNAFLHNSAASAKIRARNVGPYLSDLRCDWFSRGAHIVRTGCILPRELRWFMEWFKAQWLGVIMSKALWDTPRAWKTLYKNWLLLLLFTACLGALALSKMKHTCLQYCTWIPSCMF